MMAWEDFHFLRPWWLLALLPWAWLLLRGRLRWGPVNPWARVVDRELLSALSDGNSAASRAPAVLAALAGLIAVLALAGPAWQRLPQPEMQTREARIILLDLSQSMDAGDLAPSRLVNAREAARSLLESLPGGRFGIVAFAGTAYTVAPLTDDRRTAAHLLAMLATDLMPVQGSRIATGIELGTALLKGGEALEGDLILLTDSPADEAARSAARAAVASGQRLWVIGVGSLGGAPVPLAQGGLLKDRNGKVALPALDEESLKTLAAIGGGAYERLSERGLTLERYAWKPEQLGAAALDSGFRTDAWRDAGRWLVLALLPLAALAFRRGNLAAICLLVCLLPPPGHAQSLSELDWWQSKNDLGHQLLAEGQTAAAARTFADPQWQGVAAYRAGAYHAAATFFAEEDSAPAHYNRGNALAKAGRLHEAMAAYEQALEQAPDMDDARYNRALVQRLLPQEQQALSAPGGAPLNTAQGAAGAGAGKTRGDQSGGKSASRAAGPGSGQERSSSAQGQGQRASETASDRAQLSAEGAETGPESGGRPGTATPQPDSESQEPASNQMLARNQMPGRRASSSSKNSTEFGERSDERAQGRSGQIETRGDEIEPWLRQIEDDPGGLLRRKFQLLQAQQSAVPPGDPPW